VGGFDGEEDLKLSGQQGRWILAGVQSLSLTHILTMSAIGYACG
jgi:hypothetical protein